MTRSLPHLVLFNPDEWRGDVLGHLGNPAARTPVLDAWVETDAVSFRHAYCQSPVCTPSRTSFMTGWYPHVRGHRTMHHMLHPDEPVLLRTLKDQGYFVWWGGKNDLVPAGPGCYDAYCDVRYNPKQAGRSVRPFWALDREAEWRGAPGSDSYYSFYAGQLTAPGEDGYYDSDWANVHGAIEQIQAWGENGGGPDRKPLCIFLALTYPHPPYGAEQPWFDMIDPRHLPQRVPTPGSKQASTKPSILDGIRDRQGLRGWDEERWDRLRATYYGMCARVDYQFGLVLDALRTAGMYDNTAILFFSDHGDFAGDYGLVEKTQNTFEDCLARVPFIVKPPSGTEVTPGVRDALVELVDLPATVEAFTGLPPRHTHFGRPLLPLLHDDVHAHRDAVFCEGGRLSGERQAMELESPSSHDRTGLYWPRLSLQAEDGPAHTKAAMCRTIAFKYVRRLYEADELYDLAHDPTEEHNVADDPQYSAVRAQMAERLLSWYQETCDVVPMVPDHRD